MAAYDNVSLPGPPNGAQYVTAAGSLAKQISDIISGGFNAYQQGQDFQYKQRQQNLFQNPDQQGALQDALKTGNYAPVLQSMIQAQGASAAPVIGQLMSDQAGARLADAIRGGDTQPQQPNIGPATSTHTGPANITGNFGGGQPRQTAETNGGDTVNSIAAESHVDLDQFLARYPGARSLLNRDLTPGQASGIRQRMAQFGGGGIAGDTTKPVPASTGYEQDQNNTNEATPVGSTGGAQVSPNPQGVGPGKGETFDSRYGAAQPGAAQPGTRPTPVGTEAQAQAAETRAKNMRALQAFYAGRNPKAAEAIGARAAEEEKRAHEIRDSIGKYNEPGRIQRDVESGATLKEAQIKDDTTRYGKQLSSIQGSAQAANRMLQHIQFAEGIYKDPNFYSGAGEGLNLMYKRVVNALNPGNTDSLPQEAFRKTMAASVLNQVEQLKDDTAAVGGGGRIFQAQIELMEKAANNPDNSIPANRLLTEISKRGALESKRIAQMANSYKGGHLDAGFAQMVDDYYTKHPMFTDAEMKDIRLIAPPVAPTLHSHEEIVSWSRKAGLKPGDPVKLPNGRIVTAP